MRPDMVSVSLEPVTWALRVHPHRDGDYRNGDAYDNSATVTVDDLGCATIRGIVFDDGFDTPLALAINEAAKKQGFREVLWTRKRPGQKPRTFRHKVR